MVSFFDSVQLNSISQITRLAGYEYSMYWNEDVNGKIIALRGYNIGKNRLLLNNIANISNELSLRLKRSRLCKGDIVYPCVGTIGNAVVINKDDKYHIQQNIARIIPDLNKVNPSYLAFYLMSDFGLNEIHRFNGTSSQPNILVGSLRQYNILLPPLPEQRRIAEALSEMDSYIVTLEKLIVKKRAIKQGTMQELLTGKRRLPGFEGEWAETELITLCDIFCDGDWIEAKDQSDDGIRLIQTGNVGNGCFLNKSGKQRFVSEITFNNLNCTEVYPNDVLVSRLPDPAGRACMVPNHIGKAITAVDCTIIRFNKYNPKLFVMFSQTEQYQRQIDLVLAGSTRQRISRKDLGMVKVPYFESDEQTAIAEVLSDMDAEIDTLTAKLTKLKNIKQGMMSELLTGRIRLKGDAPSGKN